MFVPQSPQAQFSAGFLLILVLVMGSVFLLIVSSFIGYVATQNQVVNFRHEQHRATEIAEAGLNYYRWYLAHNPGDVTNGTGLPGPFVHEYKDPEGGTIGEFSLDISSNEYCGDIASIDITSTGHTYVDPDAIARISARYKQLTVADYSFINNASIRYGSTRVITGPVHGNQGVRMDGAHNSFVGAGVPTFDGNDGVYTTTVNATPGLFRFPISPIDFTGLTIDMAQIRARAQSDGIYYGPTAQDGYRLEFNSDGTIDVYEVTQTSNYWSYSAVEKWHQGERNDIRNETLLNAGLVINPDCPVLFFEDKLWIEGQVTQKVAVGVGLNTTPNPYGSGSNGQNNIVIHNNLQYVPNSDAGLVAIAEEDIDVGIEVQNNMSADGIFIAQKGRFGRNYYCTSCGFRFTDYGLPWFLDQYVSRDNLNRLGSVVSNLGGGTEWSSDGGNHLSGFRSRITSFDRNQVDDPPPLTPATNDVYELQNWQQDG
jgi:hypothetical protein